MDILAKFRIERFLKGLDAVDGSTSPPQANHQATGITALSVGMNDVETDFFHLASQKYQARLWRSGWPDFLMHTASHGFVGVEIKNGHDRIRREQRLTFAALEEAGIPVVVWSPHSPTRLVPWRKYIPPKTKPPKHRRR